MRELINSQEYFNHLFSLPLVYDTSTTSNVVVLNTIHIDIMDYIMPASCTDTEFRQMWQDFEWENKVCILKTCHFRLVSFYSSNIDLKICCFFLNSGIC